MIRGKSQFFFIFLLSFLFIVNTRAMALSHSTNIIVYSQQQEESPLTPADVLSTSNNWVPVTNSVKLKSHQAAWLKIDLDNTVNEDLYLTFLQLGIDKVTLFTLQDNRVVQQSSAGVFVPVEEWDIFSHNFVFKLPYNDKSQSFFLLIDPSFDTVLKPAVFTLQALEERNEKDLIIFWLSLGIVGMMILYHFFLYVTSRDSKFISFALYLFSWMLANLATSGFGFEYFWSHLPWLELRSDFLLSSLVGISSVFFFRSFLDSSKNYPVIDRILLYILLPLALIGFIISFFPGISQFRNFVMFRGMLHSLFNITVAFLLIKKNRNMIYLFLGFIMVFFMNVFLFMVGSAIAGDSFLYRYGIQISNVILVLFLSMGMGIEYYDSIRKGRDSEMRLHEKELDLDMIMSSLSVGVIMTDNKLDILQLNEAALAYSGWTAQQSAGRNIQELFSFQDEQERENFQLSMEMVLDDSTRYLAGQTYSIAYHKKYYKLRFNLSSVRKADDAIQGLILIVQNMTEEYNLQKQVLHSQKMDAIGQLAGGVAHDFNNMLSGIMGSAELLQMSLEEGNSEGNRESLRTILGTSVRAADLTRQLLTFSRKSEVQFKEVDLHSIIREVVILLKNTVNKNILVEEKLEAGKTLIQADASQIQNALLNLGINARDALKKGGFIRYSTRNVRLSDEASLKLVNLDKSGEYILIEVEDNGSGIPLDIQEKIFEPFFTTKQKGKGTGLGLSTVHGTIIRHQGSIKLYSELDVGTTFKIFLPCVNQTHDLKKDQQSGLVKGRGHILLVDDEKNIVLAVSRILERLGYTVSGFSEPEQALTYFREHAATIDLVITDIIMPGMSGYELYHEFWKIDPDQKIILISGFSGDVNLEKALAEGVKAYLQKPFNFQVLSQKIKEVIDS